MPLDERDAKFEKALRRHFRPECPDAETLAAYHERALAPEEMVAWKKHIASCEGCQQILAQLESTEQIPLGAEANDVLAALPMDQAEMRRLAIAQTLPQDKQPGVLPQTGYAAGGSPPIELQPRRTVWKWAAPAGAIAAGLLVWLSVSELKHPAVTPTPQAPVQVAETRTESERPEAPGETGKAQPPQKSLDAAAANKLAKQESSSRIRPKVKRAQTLNQPPANEERRGTKEYGGQIVSRPAEETPERAEAKERARPKDKIASNNTAPPAAASKSIGAVAQSVQVQAEPGSGSGTPAAAPPSPLPGAPVQDQKKDAAAGVLAQQEISGGPRSAYKRDAYLMDADSSMLHTVVSADGKRMWRLGPNGQVLLFAGNSAGWQPQLSGVHVELTAGSAPNEKVCWIVGREGTVLVTVDGGEHWRTVSSPIRSDIGGVVAADGTHARIWDVANRVSYKTSDGGVTWKQLTMP